MLLARRRPAQALPRSVVHDHDLRLDRVEKSGRAGAIQRAMTAGLIQRDLAQLVHRARELHLHGPVEIGEIEKPELAKGEQRADHAVVLGHVPRLFLGRGTQRVRLAAIHRFREQLTVRGDDVGLDAFQRNPITDLEDRSPVAADAEIGVPPPLVRRLDEIAAIEAAADRDELREGRQPALVIGVEMTEHEVVDPLQPRLLRDLENAPRIASAGFPAGVDEQRFAGRRDEQRRRTPLDVHPVDVEIARLRVDGALRVQQQQRQSKKTSCA